jgi:SAM-dependent methyltransferase
MAEESYRTRFEDRTEVENYEQMMFAQGSYGALLWNLERQFLETFLQRFPIAADELDYLDFACGTGRIVAFVEPKVMTARGIEISERMLKLATSRVSEAELVKVDITAAEAPIEGQYDLITAFRFFLNAEPALRLNAMRGLADRLRDGRSRLIFNVHGHVPSHKLLTVPQQMIRTIMGKPRSRLFMTRRQVKQLVSEAALEIEEVFGYDLFSSKALHLMPYDTLFSLERRWAGKSMAQMFGGHQLYVARKRR